MSNSSELNDFQGLIQWSIDNFNNLPWRNKRSLYTTLVSEIMLQQTTVGTVLNHYERFLKLYPTLKSLAGSSEEDLLIAWKGLGYYRRAKSLLKACCYIHEELGGEFPRLRTSLMEIPGVGPYTASALLAIGGNQRDLAVDANLERVLARYYGVEVTKGPKLQKELYSRFQAGEIVSFDEKNISYRELNESLMDIGRQVCRARKVDCILCPLSKGCQAYKRGQQLEIPQVVEKSKKKFYNLELLRIIVKKDKEILGYKKKEGQWLSGQFEIPTFIVKSEDEKLNQYPWFDTQKLKISNMKTYKTSITKYRIKNIVLEINFTEFSRIFDTKSYFWLSEKDRLGLSTGSLKSFNL